MSATSSPSSSRDSSVDRASLPYRLDAALALNDRLVVLQGPAGVGKRTLARSAVERRRLSAMLVDATALRTFDEVLDAIVAQSDTLTLDASSASAALAGTLQGSLLCGMSAADVGCPCSIKSWVGCLQPCLLIVV